MFHSQVHTVNTLDEFGWMCTHLYDVHHLPHSPTSEFPLSLPLSLSLPLHTQTHALVNPLVCAKWEEKVFYFGDPYSGMRMEISPVLSLSHSLTLYVSLLSDCCFSFFSFLISLPLIREGCKGELFLYSPFSLSRVFFLALFVTHETLSQRHSSLA